MRTRRAGRAGEPGHGLEPVEGYLRAGLEIRSEPMSPTGTPYSFDRCDGCGGPLEPESRLWGLCPACERGPLSAENERDA